MRTPHASSPESPPPTTAQEYPERDSPITQPEPSGRRAPIRTQPPPFRPPHRPATFQPPSFAETYAPPLFIGLLVLTFVGSAAFLLWPSSSPNDFDLTSEEYRMLTEAREARGPRSATSEETLPPGVHAGSAVLDIATMPSGVLVSIDGQAAGVTPVRIDHLPPRPHLVTLRSPGFSTTDTLVDLREASLTMIAVVLTPLSVERALPPLPPDPSPTPAPRHNAARNATEAISPAEPPPPPSSGSIAVRANPARIPVQLDGQTVGITPIELSDVPAGSHTLTFFLPGYESASVHVNLEPGGREDVEVTLAPETGVLVVVVRPWGSIYIDGVLRARDLDLSFEATLPAGRHQVRVEHPVLGAQERTVEVQAHRTTSAVFDLN